MSPRFQRTAAVVALTTACARRGWSPRSRPRSDEPDPNITVQDRPRPDYDPLGIRAGSFLIFPALTLSGLYDSNVFATKTTPTVDVARSCRPRSSQFELVNRNALNFAAGATGAA